MNKPLNPELDLHAEMEGLGHWKCDSKDSNRFWRRIDGVRHEAFADGLNRTWMEELREIDEKRPIKAGSWDVRLRLEEFCKERFAALLGNASGNNYEAAMQLLDLLKHLEGYEFPTHYRG